jgi:integrase
VYQPTNCCLVANPTSTNHQIAQRLNIHFTTVAEVRKRLGMSRWDHVTYQGQPQIVEPPKDSDCPPVTAPRFGLRSIPQSKAQICAQYLWHNPQVQYSRLAEILNVSTTYLCDLRKSLGMQKLRKGRSHHVLLVVPDPDMKQQLPPGGEKYLVFPSEEDVRKPPTASCCQRWAVKIQLAAGLRDTGNQPKYLDGKKYDRANHVWRHYFVTMLLSRGVHWKQIAALSGHENATMVMETYGHLVRDLEADRQVLDAAIRAARTAKLRVVSNDEKLLGTKTADFGTSKS